MRDLAEQLQDANFGYESDTDARVAGLSESKAHGRSIALMKFLSRVSKKLRVDRHVYVVGGAVRDVVLDRPIKDIDVVIDPVALKGKDSAWFAKNVAREIPGRTSLVTNQYGVAILTVKSGWTLDGHDMAGEVIEIANSRSESYGGKGGKGYKPHLVKPAGIKQDVFRREFTFNCMAGDTLIPTENGILRIDEIASREDGDCQGICLQVAGQDGLAMAVGWQYSGFAPTLRVTTEWGHSFSCTHHHPVLVLRGHDHEWVQTHRLEKGDLLCVPVQQVARKQPLCLKLSDPVQPKRGLLKKVRKPEVMTPELAFVIGCVVAEGSNTHKRVSFSNSDPVFIARYVECFDAVFGFRPSRNKVVEKGSVRILQGVKFIASADGYDVYADSKAVVGWLDEMGLYCGRAGSGKSASHHKVVPWSILQADEMSQWAFLAAYLEGDGSIRSDTGRITFCSASPYIRQQLQVLLGAHGILSRVRDRFVYINAVDSALLWEKIQPWMATKGFDYTQRTNKARNRYGIPADYIRGFLAGRKQDARAVYVTDNNESRTLPNMHEPVRKVRRLLHDAHARGDFEGFMAGLRVISQNEHARLQRLFVLGYQYVEVVLVEDAGEQDVFDISMVKGVEPAFVANGVVVHNTLLIRMADLAKGPDRKDILDITGCGLRDLDRGEVRCPSDPDKTFSDDPTRMLRAIKFMNRYGFKIAPDVAASIRRNAHKLESIPYEAVATLLVNTILTEKKYKAAIKIMDNLGLLDVVTEMLRTNKGFRNSMERWVSNRKVGFMFDLMDVGLSPGAKLGFLSKSQQAGLRVLALGMPEGEPERFLDALRQPGRVMDSQALIKELGLAGKQIAKLSVIARELLLDNPDLRNDRARLTHRVAEVYRRRMK